MGGNVKELNNMKELNTLLEVANDNNMLLLLDFYAQWCGPCKNIAPFIDGLSVNPAYYSRVFFAKADVEVAEDMAEVYEVSAMPTFILFKDGVPVGSTKGANKDAVVKMIDEMLV